MPVAESVGFFARFVRHPLQVGAVLPSSQHLAQRMVQGLDLQAGDAVVEFGPGTGSFTQAIREVLPPDGRYLGIERDERFVRLLRARFPQMRFVQGGAEDAVQHVQAARLLAGEARVRAVVCGLPFATLPMPVQQGVIRAIDALLPVGGEFRTFQYLHAYQMKKAAAYRRTMQQVIGPAERSAAVWANTPPACVLSWKRSRSTCETACACGGNC